MKLENLIDELGGLLQRLCIECRQDTMNHKEFLRFAHDKIGAEGLRLLENYETKLIQNKPVNPYIDEYAKAKAGNAFELIDYNDDRDAQMETARHNAWQEGQGAQNNTISYS
jgi:hypothetical protein